MTTISLAAMRCPRWRRRTALPTGGNGPVLRLESMCGGQGLGNAMVLEPLS